MAHPLFQAAVGAPGSPDPLVLAAAVELLGVAASRQARHHGRLGAALAALLASQLRLAAEESMDADADGSRGLGRCAVISSSLQALKALCEDQLATAATGVKSHPGDSAAAIVPGGSTLLPTALDSVRTAVMQALGLLDGSSGHAAQSPAAGGSGGDAYNALVARLRGSSGGSGKLGARSWAALLPRAGGGGSSGVKGPRPPPLPPRGGPLRPPSASIGEDAPAAGESTLSACLPILMDALCQFARLELCGAPAPVDPASRARVRPGHEAAPAPSSAGGARSAGRGSVQFESSSTRSLLLSLVKAAQSQRETAAADATRVLRFAGEASSTPGAGGSNAADRMSRNTERASSVVAGLASCSRLVHLLHRLAAALEHPGATRVVSDALVEFYVQVRTVEADVWRACVWH